ncbi:hypothetical protein [Actinosynnema pretiosum]|uniref:hypothetical protein n=1 Tax=Actinosynnema pretiosum TaxID=42197 RepID=UPI0012FD1B61|nr:hypothetical protein [Actinosynnema pretiosum]
MTRDHHRARPRPGSLRGTATEQAVRTAEGLRRRYGDVVALDGVDLRVDPGERVVLRVRDAGPEEAVLALTAVRDEGEAA